MDDGLKAIGKILVLAGTGGYQINHAGFIGIPTAIPIFPLQFRNHSISITPSGILQPPTCRRS